MPNNIKVSDMEQAVELTKDDLVMIAQPNIDPENPEAEVESYSSKKTTIEDLANTAAKDIQFTSELDTDSKTITGAINEAAAVGKKSKGYTSSGFSSDYSYESGSYQDCWEDSGESVDGHTIYRSNGGTYRLPGGDSLCTFSVEGYNNVTLYVKQDGASSAVTDKAYTVLGPANSPVSLNNYARRYDGEVLENFESYEYNYLGGALTRIQVLYHVDRSSGSGTVDFDGNSGQWVDSGETIDRHTVYKSDAGSYGVYGGTSKCTLTLDGVQSLTLYCKSEDYYGLLYVGKLDTAIDTSDYDTYTRLVNEQSDYIKIEIAPENTGEHTLEILFKDRYGDGLRGYFYYTINELNENRGYVYMVPGEPAETHGEIFGNYTDNAAFGYYSHAEGSNTKAYGSNSHSEGYNNKTIGQYSHAEGMDNEVYSESGHVEGGRNKAYSEKSHAEGADNIVRGAYGHVEGYNNQAIGTGTHAEGGGNLARDYYAHAEGQYTQALGGYSHAEGYKTIALYTAAHAEGFETQANGSYTHAEGYYTRANSAYCHTEGEHTTANYGGGHAEGNYTLSNAQGAHAEGKYTDANGEGSHAEGYGGYNAHSIIASSEGSHAEGYGHTNSDLGSGPITASGKGAHAEGTKTTASGNFSHAEGRNNIASGVNSHAEGFGTTANSFSAHAEGESTSALSICAHTEGYLSSATAYNTHAEGKGTQATGAQAHAEGEYSIASGQGSHAEGYGDSTYHSVASGQGAHAEGQSTASNSFAHSEGNNTLASGEYSHAEGYNGTRATAMGSHAEGNSSYATGVYSHVEGGNSVASGQGSHAEGGGTYAYGDHTHTEGAGTRAYGSKSHAEGAGTETFGVFSHVEGAGNVILGSYGHMEGAGNASTGSAFNTHTEGGGNFNYSPQGHIEGSGNTISGEESHGEGAGNQVHGAKNHGEGGGNNVYGIGSHVEGKHNSIAGFAVHAEGSDNLIGSSTSISQFDYGTDYLEGAIVGPNANYVDFGEGSSQYLYRCKTAPGKIQEGNGVEFVTASSWSSSTDYPANSVVYFWAQKGCGYYYCSSAISAQNVPPPVDNSGWTRINSLLSPFKSGTYSGYYLIRADQELSSGISVAKVASDTSIEAMWEPIPTPHSSHIEGLGNISTGDYQHVQGKYNIADSTKAFIIGNGIKDGNNEITRSNALTVDWDGNTAIAGDLTVGAINDTISGLAARIPAAPTTDGTYVLSVTVLNGEPTYSWVASS